MERYYDVIEHLSSQDELAFVERISATDVCDSDGYSALMIACEQERFRLIRLLMDAGSDPMRPDTEGESAWDRAINFAIEDNEFGVLSVLISCGVNIDQLGVIRRRTALMQAASSSTVATRWLLAHGASVLSVDEQGQTALHFAVGLDGSYDFGRDAAERVRLLLTHGSDPFATTREGKLPRDILDAQVIEADARSAIEAMWPHRSR